MTRTGLLVLAAAALLASACRRQEAPTLRSGAASDGGAALKPHPLAIGARAIGPLDGNVPFTLEAVRKRVPTAYEVRVFEEREGGKVVYQEILVLEKLVELVRLVGGEGGKLAMAVVLAPGPRDAHGAQVGTRYRELKGFYPDLRCERNKVDDIDLLTCRSATLPGVEFNFDASKGGSSDQALPIWNITVEMK